MVQKRKRRKKRIFSRTFGLCLEAPLSGYVTRGSSSVFGSATGSGRWRGVGAAPAAAADNDDDHDGNGSWLDVVVNTVDFFAYLNDS